jgi:ligand-binding SRPBCC domain-containing protein
MGTRRTGDSSDHRGREVADWVVVTRVGAGVTQARRIDSALTPLGCIAGQPNEERHEARGQ